MHLKVKLSPFTHKDIIKEARDKYPGLNLFVTLVLYNNLQATIYKNSTCITQRKTLSEKIKLAYLLISALDNFTKPEGRN